MTATYNAQRITNTDNGWLLIHNETGKQDLVFCAENANTAEDAIAVLESVQNQTEEAEE